MRGAVALLLISVFLTACNASRDTSGELLFATHCSGCHPEGGNTINPARTLSRSHLEANGIRTAEDLAAYIRKPGPGMPAFSEGMIPEKDAIAIGEYVMKTFR